MPKPKQKFTTKSKLKTSLQMLLGLIILAALAIAGYMIFIKKDGSNSNQSIESNQAERTETEDYKKQLEEESNAAQNNSDSPGQVYEEDPNKVDNNSTETSPTTPSAPASASLGSINFSQSAGVVRASTTVAGSSGGSCEFLFSAQDERPVSKTVNLSGNSCAVEIPEVEFSYIGKWNLKVSYGSVSKSTEVSIK